MKAEPEPLDMEALAYHLHRQALEAAFNGIDFQVRSEASIDAATWRQALERLKRKDAHEPGA